MPRGPNFPPYQPADVVKGISNTISLLMKHSRNQNFIDYCFYRLQASNMEEAEERLKLVVWAKLHRFQGVPLPPEIIQSMRQQEQSFTVMQPDGAMGYDTFVEQRSARDPPRDCLALPSTSGDPPRDYLALPSTSGDPLRDCLALPITSSDPPRDSLALPSTSGDPLRDSLALPSTSSDPPRDSLALPSTSGDPLRDCLALPSTSSDPPRDSLALPSTSHDPPLSAMANEAPEQRDENLPAGLPSAPEGDTLDRGEALPGHASPPTSTEDLTPEELPSSPNPRWPGPDSILQEGERASTASPEGVRLVSQDGAIGRIDRALDLLSQTPTISALEKSYARAYSLIEAALATLSEGVSVKRKRTESIPVPSQEPWSNPPEASRLPVGATLPEMALEMAPPPPEEDGSPPKKRPRH